MNVLIACEESQEVCKAFRARGHEAYSCDVQEPSGERPEWHILGDATEALRGGGGCNDGRKGTRCWEVGLAHCASTVYVPLQCRSTTLVEKSRIADREVRKRNASKRILFAIFERRYTKNLC